MNREILCKPFTADQLKQRKGRSGQIFSYIEAHAVISRLNEACDRWDFEVLEHTVHENEVIVLGKLTADGVVKSAFGGSGITTDQGGRVVSLADDLKAAASDSLKKCASLLGVGLELYANSSKTADRTSDNTNAGNGRVREDSALGDRITSRQLGAVYAVCRKLAVKRDDLYAIVKERFGAEKPELLSKGQASELIDHFQHAVPAQP